MPAKMMKLVSTCEQRTRCQRQTSHSARVRRSRAEHTHSSLVHSGIANCNDAPAAWGTMRYVSHEVGAASTHEHKFSLILSATLCDMKAVSYDLPKDFRTLTIGNASSAFSCDKAALPALCGREGQSCPALGKRERAFPPNPTPGTAGLTNAEPKASLSEPEKA